MTFTLSCPTISTQERTITVSLNLACFVPQFSFFPSKPAFVLPNFGNLLTAKICSKVWTTAKIGYLILFSRLVCFMCLLKPSGRELLIYLSHMMRYIIPLLTKSKLLAGFFFQVLHLISSEIRICSFDQLEKNLPRKREIRD